MTRAERPTLEQIERELARRDTVSRYSKALRVTLIVLIVVSALSVLAATIFFPVLTVTGTSMTPLLEQDQIVVVAKGIKPKTGDVAAFYYNNKILLKRVIAGSGDMVDIDDKGNVYVNDKKLDEPYAVEKGEGECDITLPFQVPEDSWFVMGDHRSTSIDSRSTQVGCIKDEDVLGVIFLRVYPFGDICIFNY